MQSESGLNFAFSEQITDEKIHPGEIFWDCHLSPALYIKWEVKILGDPFRESELIAKFPV